MTACEYGPEGKCGRKSCRQVDGRGICHSHRRAWIAGKPLDEPVRGYQRHGEGPDGGAVPIRASMPRPRRPKPFAAEMTLLQELGLR